MSVQTIEQTGKTWKALRVFSFVVMGSSFFWGAWGLPVFVLGGALYFFARMMAWWRHA